MLVQSLNIDRGGKIDLPCDVTVSYTHLDVYKRQI